VFLLHDLKDQFDDMSLRSGKKIVSVSPVFNDWDAFGKLIEQLGLLDETGIHEVHVIAIDDCSSESADVASLNARRGHLADVRVVKLACNLGPMRAIAAGLVVASKVHDLDAAIVMDADGEDRPDDIGKLIAAWDKQPTRIVVAKRRKRSEGRIFRSCYAAYKLIFKLLTGQAITFGSFSLIPRPALQSLIRNPAIWNNLPAAIVRSRIPYTELETKRGTRFSGQSRMNFVTLAVHGVSAISVYTDVALLRIIIAMGILASTVVVALVCIFIIKFYTDWATPGWASYVSGSLAIIFLQTLTFSGLALLQLLSVRNLKYFVPVSDVGAFMCDSELDNIVGASAETNSRVPHCEPRS
jgi:polyisoprenyl-phosphate glycosyltransferase